VIAKSFFRNHGSRKRVNPSRYRDGYFPRLYFFYIRQVYGLNNCCIFVFNKRTPPRYDLGVITIFGSQRYVNQE
jgi:hypothetical protein